jgi:hypothetical protein
VFLPVQVCFLAYFFPLLYFLSLISSFSYSFLGIFSDFICLLSLVSKNGSFYFFLLFLLFLLHYLLFTFFHFIFYFPIHAFSFPFILFSYFNSQMNKNMFLLFRKFYFFSFIKLVPHNSFLLIFIVYIFMIFFSFCLFSFHTMVMYIFPRYVSRTLHFLFPM